MAKWYEDRKSMAHVASYENEKELNKELHKAAKHGWIVKDATGLSGQINIGRTMTRAALTGGIGLLFGGSRTEGKMIVTYERDPWIAPMQEAEERIASLVGDYENAFRKVAERNRQCSSHWPLPQDEKKSAEQAKKLSDALDDRSKARDKLSEVAMKLAEAIESAQEIYNRAGDAPPERRYAAPGLRAISQREASLRAEDSFIKKAYEDYSKITKKLVDAREELDKKAKRLQDARRKAEESKAALSRATVDKDRMKAEEKISEAQRNADKAQAEVTTSEQEVSKAAIARSSMRETLPKVTLD